MDFKTTKTESAIEVRIAGRMDFTDHDRLPDILSQLDGTRNRLILDMSRLDFIDSAGLGMLLIIQDEAEGQNVKLIVRGVAGDVKRSIELARLSEIITFQD
ncbi:anti-sigma factor antagonist [Azospirillum sp. 412522]|nr:STAS domain-containing protein [Azospirillum sp. 412522]MBY6263032.1 anti-sigma factor antagonist [Azospirillum sp. 412522]